MAAEVAEWHVAACYVVCLYAGTWLLNMVLPGRRARGSATDCKGKQLEYKLNGLACVAVLLVVLYALTYLLPSIQLDFIIINFRACATVGCVIGVLASVCLHVAGDSWPGHVSAHEMTPSGSAVKRFFLGAELNPRLLGLDIKMWLYLVGVFMVILNMVASVVYCHHYSTTGLHPLFLLYVAEMLWFCFDYLIFEHIQLTTYDLFAENVGFKLAWGCIFFYPFFYPVGVWPLLPLPAETATPVEQLQLFPGQCVVSAALFLGGWILSRGANLQKYAFKTAVVKNRNRVFFIPQETIAGKLLISGFWGLSRHINYLGEVMMALAMAMCGGLAQPFSYRVLLPWLYPLYYVVLLVTRERDDNRRCAQKYGSLWAVYEKRVPYRIIPYIY